MQNGEEDADFTDGERILLSLIGSYGNGPSLALDFLSCRDRLQLLSVSRNVSRRVSRIEYHRCKDGRIYHVPFPGYIGLLDKSDGDGLFPHQLASLHAMHKAENRCTEFGALRGGILGDAPGLGKSITMLAMIVATAGQRPKPPPDEYDPNELQEGWEALSQNPSRATDIIQCVKPFRPIRGLEKTILKSTTPPFPLSRFPTLESFQRYVRNIARRNSATDAEIEQFRRATMILRSSLAKSNRKEFKSVAGRRKAWERSLIPACTTLVIVPDALLEHWCQQCLEHLNLQMLAASTSSSTDGRGVVFLDGVGDILDATMPLGTLRRRPLANPLELASYSIVVTTFSRCKDEFNKEIRLSSSSGDRKREHAQLERKGKDFSSNLLQVRWLRIVVDEGHELGSHEGGNQLTRFIHELAAERRWVMSGTPVVGDLDDSRFSSKALNQIQRLLVYLRHPTYGSPPAKQSKSIYTDVANARDTDEKTKDEARKAWHVNVKLPFLAKMDEGRVELLRVLREISVIHNKEDINLPKPSFEFAEVDIPLPDVIQTRLQESGNSAQKLLGAYLHSDDFQELVDKAQGNYITDSVLKARKALIERGGPFKAAGEMKIMSHEELEAQARRDRRPIKAVVYSSNHNILIDVTESIYKRLNSENIAEAYDDLRYHPETELSRFRHDKREVRRCQICDHFNNHEGSASMKRQATCQNFLLEVVDRDDEQTRFLIEAERIVRALPPHQGGNVPLARLQMGRQDFDFSTYADNRRAWRSGDIVEVDITDPHPLLKKRWSEKDWKSLGSDKCIELAKDDNFFGSDWYFGPLPAQGDQRTMVVVIKKWQMCSRYHSSRWYAGPRLGPVEVLKEDCFMLALDAGLSHGLDLSFVTHIFLLEPVEDAALLEQITSRAHRLGATGPVTVCTVNTFYSLDPKTKLAVEASRMTDKSRETKEGRNSGSSAKSSESSRKKTVLQTDQKGVLTKVVCQYCFRNFNTYKDAEAHEEFQCPRNPSNAGVRDPWHISSIYRQLKPPAPYETEQGN